MKTRILQTKIWKDSYFSSLNLTERLIFLYLLTNDKVNILHCYEISSREIAFDTGINTPMVEDVKAKFQKGGRFEFFKDWVLIINAYKYEEYKGEKNETAKTKLIREMSKDVKGWYDNVLDRGIDRGMHTLSIGSISHNTEIISHKGVVKGKRPIEIYTTKFNELFKSNFQIIEKRAEKLNLRLKKFPLPEILKALYNLSTSSFHKGENESGWVADPDFLIRSDSQIDKWLNQKPKNKDPFADYKLIPRNESN